MTKDDAVFWLKQIKERYIKGGDEEFDRCRKEAIDMAVKVLEKPSVVWHPFPQEKPSETKEYLTYIRVPYGGDMYDICEWDCDGVFVKGWDYTRDVVVYAWAELPEPYKEAEDG